MNGAPSYGVGLVGLTVGAVAIAAGAVALRRRAVPGWSGALARLAEVVLGLALLVATTHALGAAGWFTGPLVLGAAIVVGGALWVTRPPATGPTEAPPRSAGRLEVGLSSVAVASVALAWAARIATSYQTGILSDDSLGYHLPWATRFAATGSILPIHYFTPGLTTNMDPATNQVLHAVPMLAFGSDVASPVVNGVWLAVALLAGWCVGRREGLSPSTMSAVALVAAIPLMARSQAGQGLNDLAAMALLLAAVAFLRHADGRWPTIALAGVAAGMGLSIKLNVAVAVAALCVLVMLVAPAGRRLRDLGVFSATAGVAGGFWFVRNWVEVGSPLPQLALPGFPALEFPLNEATGYSVAHYATDTSLWRQTFLPETQEALGGGWPLVVLLAGAGVLLALWARDRAITGLGLLALAMLAGYLVTPGSAFGPDGQPVLFRANLRIAVPALLVALVIVPVAVRRVRDARRWDLAVLIGLVVATLLVQVPVDSSFATWPSGGRRMAVLGAAWAAAAAFALWAHRRWGGLGPQILGGLLLVVAVLGGAQVHDDYLHDRYRTGGTVRQAAYLWARDVHDARIAVAGFYQTHPLTGTDLSNHVQWEGVHPRAGEFEESPDCATWRRLVSRGDYDYVVTAPFADAGVGQPDEATWTESDPGARVVVRAGLTTVFALAAPLDPAACP